MKKIAETGGAAAAMDFLREDEKKRVRLGKHALRLGGLITASAGIGFMAFLYAIEKEEPVFLIGLVPVLVGAALIIYAVTSTPKE